MPETSLRANLRFALKSRFSDGLKKGCPMPHLIMEYSNNLNLPVQPVLRTLHGVLLESGQFEENHIKIRARRYDDYLTGGSAAGGFVHLTLFLLDGRSEAVKRALGQALCSAVRQALGNAGGTQITVDTRDMRRAVYAKITIQP